MDGSTKSPHAVTLLKFCVLSQFVIRAIHVYPSNGDATRKSPILLRGHFWVGAAFNLLLYIIVRHFLGAFWYLLSVGRNMDCWIRACQSHGCDVSTLYCIGSSGDKTYLDQSCSIGISNPAFDFGIYLPALQSNIVSSSDFSLKLTYCFWWGLQNLSTFAQNLTPNVYKWEICFSISISICGLILFSLLIGNMQELAHMQQFIFWKNYRNKRLKRIAPRPLPEPSEAPPDSATLPSSVPPTPPVPASAPVMAPAPPVLSPMQYGVPDIRNAATYRRKRKNEER